MVNGEWLVVNERQDRVYCFVRINHQPYCNNSPAGNRRAVMDGGVYFFPDQSFFQFDIPMSRPVYQS